MPEKALTGIYNGWVIIFEELQTKSDLMLNRSQADHINFLLNRLRYAIRAIATYASVLGIISMPTSG